MSFTPGLRIRVPSRPELGWATIDDVRDLDGGAVRLYVQPDGDDQFVRLELTSEQSANCEVLTEDGSADGKALLAGLWTVWMRAAGTGAQSAVLASSPLTPYAHQMNAVYGAMLPQPRLRFLLADEPGTGKTIMAGLYLREMQRLGFIRSALIVVPAHLVSKWQADFERFFGGGLRAITAQTVREHGLDSGHDLWVVSLDLLSVNGAVQDAVHPDRMGWDAVVFDEAHRLTPTAVGYYQAGEMLALNTPRALLMTATPHRGKEWLFRALLHLVDPEVFPAVESNKEPSRQVKPGRVHFLRRMKEDLVDFDGTTKLFKGRHAENRPVRLSPVEAEFYTDALDLVDRYFPTVAVPLGKMVYGKRAASSLHALAETLKRRRDGMGTQMPAAAAQEADPNGDDPTTADEARIVHEGSKSAKAERKEIDALLARLGPLVADMEQPASKWDPLVLTCLGRNGIKPGNGEQAVVFTECADTADWLVRRLLHAGFTAKRYSGRDNHHTRDETRDAFARRGFQVLVSTDAGNEGIDLQTAHVLVNYDIPWSLVRLEQRMGRIHRVGQTRDVELYNLIATDTREGAVLEVLLGNFITAANQLEGRMFDSLSLVGELVGLDDTDLSRVLADTFGDEAQRARALAAVSAVTASRLADAAKRADEQERALGSSVDISQAVAALQHEQLDRINPTIVEAFLLRAADGGAIKVSPHAAGDGMFTLALPSGSELPREFAPPGQRRAGTTALIATSGKSLAAARLGGAGVSDAVNLGPSDPPFKALVAHCADTLSPAMFRGAGLVDQTSSTNYDLFAYEAEFTEAGGRRKGTWACLVRVDSAGARLIRWENLANLVPADGPAGAPHPAHAHDAAARAAMEGREEQQRRSKALDEWLRVAQRELDLLPNELTNDIGDRDARIAERGRLKAMTNQRLADLRQMSEVTIGDPRRLAWARVAAAAPPAEPTETDSERISSDFVAETLRVQGYAVSDVHTEGRGYDLHASRGREQRLIEIKGVWNAASSNGISMTANEVLIATQHGNAYWLYVVDNCNDGKGRMYGAYPNPVRTFRDLTRGDVIIYVPGSALKAARDLQETAPCA